MKIVVRTKLEILPTVKTRILAARTDRDWLIAIVDKPRGYGRKVIVSHWTPHFFAMMSSQACCFRGPTPDICEEGMFPRRDGRIRRKDGVKNALMLCRRSRRGCPLLGPDFLQLPFSSPCPEFGVPKFYFNFS
jgi:hypothetical protein